MTRSPAPPLLPAACAILALLGAGCPSAGKSDARAEARHARPDAGFDAGTSLIDPASGAPVLLTGERLPESFPKAVLLYPGAKVLGVVVTSESGKRTHVVTLATPDPPVLVDEFYRTHTRGLMTTGEHASADSRDRTLDTVDAIDAGAPLRLTISAVKSGLGTTVQITTVEG